jgi:hypothetical protein
MNEHFNLSSAHIIALGNLDKWEGNAKNQRDVLTHPTTTIVLHREGDATNPKSCAYPTGPAGLVVHAVV